MTRPPVLPGLGAGSSPNLAPRPAFDIEARLASAIRAQDAGSAAEAERGYRLLLTLAPRDPRMPAHLAVLLLEQGRAEEALPLLDQTLALDPGQAGMWVNKGNVLIGLGRFSEAIAVYGQAIALQAEDERVSGWINLGVYLQGLGRHDDAAEAYLKAMALEPELPEGWGNLGVARLEAGRLEEAVEAFDRAVALRPDYADAWTNRGTALQALRRSEEALASFDRALAIQPAQAGGWSGRSTVLQDMDRFDEAVEATGKALSLDPEGAAAWNNRGMALQALGRIEEAHASYDQAIALKPAFPDALWNKALLLLMLGEYEEGWRLSEWRWRRSDATETAQDFGLPLWLGDTPIAGKRLLLHTEQGYGDAIQMLRYAPLLARMGAKVDLVCPEALVELAATVEGLPAPAATKVPADFDLQTPIMSLPLALGTTFDTVPAEVPYLKVPERAKAAWAERLPDTGRRKIGLAWSGNPTHRNDRNRSIPFADLGPLLEADVEFHSLQKDYRPGELEAVMADGKVVDHSAELMSFADTAALIDGMDAVLVVDTSTAHLAGALGKPVTILLPFAPDFRWGLKGEKTPWYPTARLLRQQRAGDWTPVIAEAAASLKA